MRRLSILSIFCGVLFTFSSLQTAFAQTKVRFSLDWIPGATHGAFFIAQQKGYYKAEGLDVSIDRGKGSAELTRQLASGVYDMGFPDINVVMDFDSKNPQQAFPVLMSLYEEAPAAIIFLKSSGINDPKQLAGKRIGAAPNDSTFKLFPIFAQQVGVDPSSVEIQSIDPGLREVLLAQRKVDAIPGQIFNSVIELKAKGVAESDIGFFMYKDYGLQLYGNSIAASPKFLREHPDAVKGFIRATIRGLKDMANDPEEAVKAALQYEPLLNADIERSRLRIALDCCLLTNEVKKSGFGVVDNTRLQREVDVIATVFKMPRKPELKEIYDPSFLPPQKDRQVGKSN